MEKFKYRICLNSIKDLWISLSVVLGGEGLLIPSETLSFKLNNAKKRPSPDGQCECGFMFLAQLR